MLDASAKSAVPSFEFTDDECLNNSKENSSKGIFSADFQPVISLESSNLDLQRRSNSGQNSGPFDNHPYNPQIIEIQQNKTPEIQDNQF